MFNRLISNIVLGFFVVVLVVVYGVSKQQPVYQPIKMTQGDRVEVAQNDQINLSVSSESEKNILMPNGTEVFVQIADTQEERERGLSGTEQLGDDQGMLFVFDQMDLHGMWMKDMKYDLDLIWLDESGRVVHAISNVKSPLTGGDMSVYKSQEPAKYVLELPAGKAVLYGLTTGMQIAIS